MRVGSDQCGLISRRMRKERSRSSGGHTGLMKVTKTWLVFLGCFEGAVISVMKFIQPEFQKHQQEKTELTSALRYQRQGLIPRECVKCTARTLPNECKREPNSVFSVTYSDLLCHSTILLFPSLLSFPLPFFHHSVRSFHTSLPFTPSSPSVGFTPPLFPLPPCPANLFQKKGYHGERITSAHTSPRAKREITQRRKMGVGYRQAEKRRESVYSNSKLTPLLW